MGEAEIQYYYRMEDKQYARSDPWGHESYTVFTQVVMKRYVVIRKTPKGCWITSSPYVVGVTINTAKRFILDEATKRWALPTLEEARESYLARKAKQCKIYMARAQKARSAMYQGWITQWDGKYHSPADTEGPMTYLLEIGEIKMAIDKNGDPNSMDRWNEDYTHRTHICGSNKRVRIKINGTFKKEVQRNCYEPHDVEMHMCLFEVLIQIDPAHTALKIRFPRLLRIHQFNDWLGQEELSNRYYEDHQYEDNSHIRQKGSYFRQTILMKAVGIDISLDPPKPGDEPFSHKTTYGGQKCTTKYMNTAYPVF